MQREQSPNGSVGTVDAVVIVPGIMGSTLDLLDGGSQRQVWGLGTAMATSAGVASKARLADLRVRDAELTGELRRFVPSGLVMLPQWLPGFGGIEPYWRIVRTATETVLHPDAVLAFAYDWRLDVEHNARLLARAANAHLKRWRDHERLRELRSRRNDDREPRLVFLAHSMGGLLVRAMSWLDVEQPETRAVVTLATPFAGSVKAMAMLAGGRRGPSAEAARLACSTMPGVYDLLPWYRCLLADDDVLVLGEADVVTVGGRPDLVAQAFQRRGRTTTAALTGHRAVIGVGQDTAQSLELRGTQVLTRNWGYRRNQRGELIRESGRLTTEDFGGDGTVFRYAAGAPSAAVIPVAQRHESVAANKSALHLVRNVLTEAADLDTVLGGDEAETPLGLSAPDALVPGAELEIRIRSDRRPGEITCVLEDTGRNDRVVRKPDVRGRPDGDVYVVRTVLDAPGLHRIRVAAGSSEVTELVMVDAAVADAG